MNIVPDPGVRYERYARSSMVLNTMLEAWQPLFNPSSADSKKSLYNTSTSWYFRWLRYVSRDLSPNPLESVQLSTSDSTLSAHHWGLLAQLLAAAAARHWPARVLVVPTPPDVVEIDLRLDAPSSKHLPPPPARDLVGSGGSFCERRYDIDDIVRTYIYYIIWEFIFHFLVILHDWPKILAAGWL